MKIAALIPNLPPTPGVRLEPQVVVVLSPDESRQAITDYLEKHGLGCAGSGLARIEQMSDVNAFQVRVEMAPGQWVVVSRVE